jgi:uncharacterized membrane protein
LNWAKQDAVGVDLPKLDVTGTRKSYSCSFTDVTEAAALPELSQIELVRHYVRFKQT